MITERSVTLAAGPLTLDARLAVPDAPKAGIALCHPHPLYGGDMENPVVVRAAEVCHEAGLATLRFDFRGVGASTGAFDEGRGEQDDLGAALDHLAQTLPPGARARRRGLLLRRRRRRAGRDATAARRGRAHRPGPRHAGPR